MASIQQIKTAVQKLGAAVVDLPPSLATAEEAAGILRPTLQCTSFKGVIILGGYDIIPARQLDVLTPDLRNELREKRRLQSDADDFIVWSDGIYGDINGDEKPELSVSRIPDGKDLQLVLRCLSTSGFSPTKKFEIRNIARPFAHLVYEDLPGVFNKLEISEIFAPHNVIPNSASGAVYYMLHGSD